MLQQLLKRVRTDFSPQTWAAFQAVTFADRSADEVATELNMTTNAVFIAKSRVLARLRHEAQGLIDDSLTY